MKSKMILIAVVLVALGIYAVLRLVPPAPPIAELTDPPLVQSAAVAVSVDEQPPGLSPSQRRDENRAKAEQLTDEQLLEMGINPDYREWIFGEAAGSFRQEFYLLMPQHLPGPESCYDVVYDGSDSSTRVCQEPEPHEYFGYSRDALEQLALQDAEAQQVLGFMKLLEDPLASETHFIKAAVMSGKPGPLIEYIGMNNFYSWEPGTQMLTNPEAAIRSLTIAAAADSFGYPYTMAANVRKILSERGISESVLDAAENSYQELLDSVGVDASP